MPAVLWDKQHEHYAQELYNYTHGEQDLEDLRIRPVGEVFMTDQLYNYTHGDQEHLRIRPVGEVFMTEPSLHDTTFLSKSGLDRAAVSQCLT